MDEKAILASSESKAEKARQLFNLGKTRREVADLVLNGNVGWAYNIQAAYNTKKLKEKPEATAEKQKVSADKQGQKQGAQKEPKPSEKPVATKQEKPAQKTVKLQPTARIAPRKPAIKKASAVKGKVATKTKSKKGKRL